MDQRRERPSGSHRAPASAGLLAGALAVAGISLACNHDKLSREETRVDAKVPSDRDQAGRQRTRDPSTDARKASTDPSTRPSPDAGLPKEAPPAGGATAVVPGTQPPVPCVDSTTEKCGPFPHELVEWCLERAAGGSACRGNKWAKALYDGTVAQLRAHLSGMTQATAWAPCPAVHVAKDKKVLLRPMASYDDAALLEIPAPATLVPLQQWGVWRKVRSGEKEGWTLGALVSCTPPA